LRDHKDIANAIEVKIRESSGVVTNTMLDTSDDSEMAEAAE
jgi:recombination protein RecA